MRRLALLLVLSFILGATQIDVRIISSYSTPAQSPAYNAFMNFLQSNPDLKQYFGVPNFGLALTTPPNAKQTKGLLLMFDTRATTGNITQDKILARQYVHDVILTALQEGMRVAIITSPKSSLGQLVLTYLGIIIPTKVVVVGNESIVVPACNPGVKPLSVPQELHPIYKGVQVLPGACCMVPFVPDVVAPVSLGQGGKYCVIIRLTKLSDEMIILSWNGIYRDISSNPNVQKLLRNVVLYLAFKLQAKYPKTPYTVTVTKTITTTSVTTVTNNITVILSTTSWLTTTVYRTLTTTLFSTLTQFLTSTLTQTKTLYKTITSYITLTKSITTTITTTSNITITTVSKVTTTLYKTLYNTITTTVTKVKTDIKTAAGAAIGGIILGIVLALAIRGAGSKPKRTSLAEEW